MKLSFFPWMRQGLGNAINSAVEGARPQVSLFINVNPGSAAVQAIEVKAELLGPGDVQSVDRRSVIRTWPASGMEIESTQLAAIEFDAPDFPWQFSPQVPDADQLRPWLQLVVIEPGPGVTLTETPGKNAVLRLLGNAVIKAQLPEASECWAFAHGQVAGDFTPEEAKAALQSHPGQSSSRLLAARQLEKGRRYIGCLVPTWESGRRAGLGDTTGGSAKGFAWALDKNEVELPVYYSWPFSCSAAAGFEELARKLQPETSPADDSKPGDLGRRTAFASKAPALSKGFAFEVPSLFRSMKPEDSGARPPAPQDAERFRKAITSLQNKKRSLVPPVYGAVQVPNQGWVDTLNQDAALRAVANLGVRIVQEQQEALVSAIWNHLQERPQQAVKAATEQVRGALQARLLGPQGQLKSSPELAVRFTAGSGLTAPTPQDAISAVRPLAALLPSVRRLSVIPGRPSQMGRFARAVVIPPAPGISTLEGAGLLSPARLAEVLVKSVVQNPIFQLVDRVQPFPRGEVWTEVTLSPRFPGVLGGAGSRVEPRKANVPWHLHEWGAGVDNTQASEFREAARAVQRWLIPALYAQPPPVATPNELLSDVDLAAAEAALASFGKHSAGSDFTAPTSASTEAGEIEGNELTPLGVRYPMWKLLHALDPQAVLAHDDEVSMNRLTLLKVVPEVHEAFLAGLNHELLREVRWRRIPLAGAPIFFDTVLNGVVREIRKLDQPDSRYELAPLWRATCVLLVRAELIRAQPGLMVYANQYRKVGSSSEVSAGRPLPPLFSGELDEHTRFYGFAIPEAQLTDDRFGWRFVFEEPPTEPCFLVQAKIPAGDARPASPPPGPLSVAHFQESRTAAELAIKRLKQPIRASMRAKRLLAGARP